MSVNPFSAYSLIKDLFKLVVQFFTEREIDTLVWQSNDITPLINAGRLDPPKANYSWGNPNKTARRVEIDRSHEVAWCRGRRRRTKQKVINSAGSVLLRKRAD